jgi:hypothetical protein
MTNIINLTPHDIRIRIDDSNEPVPLETDMVFQSQGHAFITTKSETPLDGLYNDVYTPDLGRIPQAEIEYGPVSDLPDLDGDTIFIVAMPTAQFLAAAGRVDDIRYPDTGKPAYCVRTAAGQPYATRRLLKAKIV